MAVLCQLKKPEQYVACTWELSADPEGREYWIDHFATHIETILAAIAQQHGKQEAAKFEQFREQYHAGLQQRREDPQRFKPLTILSLDAFRDEMLRRFGWYDPFEQIKRREDDAAASLFPQVLRELDEHPMPQRFELLIRGIFAGNIFDLGSKATVQHYERHGLDFFATRDRLPARPWLIDDLDALAARFANAASPYKQVLFFVDNAGADLVLGCLPLARQLALWGSRVVLAANNHPSLNDVTVPELRRILGELSQRDAVLAELLQADRIATVGSGNGAPLIDLSRISEECNAAAAESDLILLEGMGRAVESNFEAEFQCDALKLAMLKDEMVARRIGGKLFDVVCKFEPAT